jgi:hypothetical protein
MVNYKNKIRVKTKTYRKKAKTVASDNEESAASATKVAKVAKVVKPSLPGMRSSTRLRGTADQEKRISYAENGKSDSK